MIKVPQGILEHLLTHAASAHPRECCGLLLGERGRITQAQPTRNVHPHPGTHFEIDPAALIAAHKAERAGGAHLIGYYHSHPTGDPEPSSTDRAQAAHDGKVWAIVAGGPEKPEVRFFRDGEDGFEALSYEVAPR